MSGANGALHRDWRTFYSLDRILHRSEQLNHRPLVGTVNVILSAEFEREPTLPLNFDRIDASDAIERMHHEMDFKKTTGFAAVNAIAPMASITSTG